MFGGSPAISVGQILGKVGVHLEVPQLPLPPKRERRWGRGAYCIFYYIMASLPVAGTRAAVSSAMFRGQLKECLFGRCFTLFPYLSGSQLFPAEDLPPGAEDHLLMGDPPAGLDHPLFHNVGKAGAAGHL